MATKTLRNRSFGEAMARIGEILASIQDGDTDIDTLVLVIDVNDNTWHD